MLAVVGQALFASGVKDGASRRLRIESPTDPAFKTGGRIIVPNEGGSRNVDRHVALAGQKSIAGAVRYLLDHHGNGSTVRIGAKHPAINYIVILGVAAEVRIERTARIGGTLIDRKLGLHDGVNPRRCARRKQV